MDASESNFILQKSTLACGLARITNLPISRWPPELQPPKNCVLEETITWHKHCTETCLKEVGESYVLWEGKRCRIMCVLIAWFIYMFTNKPLVTSAAVPSHYCFYKKTLVLFCDVILETLAPFFKFPLGFVCFCSIFLFPCVFLSYSAFDVSGPLYSAWGKNEVKTALDKEQQLSNHVII